MLSCCILNFSVMEQISAQMEKMSMDVKVAEKSNVITCKLLVINEQGLLYKEVGS